MSEVDSNLKYLILPIDGMTCASCSARVKKSLDSVEWIQSADVNLAAEQAAIGYRGGLINTDELKKTISDAGYSIRLRTSEIIIPGFTDPTKIKSLQNALADIPGLEETSFNTANETLSLKYIPGIIAVTAVEKIVARETGTRIVWREQNSDFDEVYEKEAQKRLKWQLITAVSAIVSALFVFILTMPAFFPFIRALPGPLRHLLAFLLTTGILFGAGHSILKGFFRKLLPGKSDMNTLVAIGAGTAWIYSTFVFVSQWIAPADFGNLPIFFDSAAFIVSFILLGRSLEARARKKTGAALNSLAKLQPDKARKKTGSTSKMVLVSTLRSDDECIVKNGERIPADGILLSDFAEIDEAMLSGESLPVQKETGQLLLTGTINTGSELLLKVLKTGADTALGQIVRWVRKAQNSQPPVQQLVDKIAAVFVPAVISLAVLTLLIWLISAAPLSMSLMHFINVIVIACPCALGLATPTAIIVSMGRAANTGMLIKDAAVLEKLLDVNTILFDKTGTLTTGTLVFKSALLFSGDEDQIIQLGASLERHSTHPISKAIIEEAQQRQLQILVSEKVEMLPGFGIRANIAGKSTGIGNKKLMQAMQVQFPEDMEKQLSEIFKPGVVGVYLAQEKKLLAVIALTDSVKKEAAETLKKLKEINIQSAMVTGDSERTARMIADQLGIMSVYAEQPPQVKASVVKQIQQKGAIVAMVGDGINDAVALSQADIGIAFAEGTDVAVDAADMVLLRSDLDLIFQSIKLARRTERIIKQNLGWAFGYNLLMIPSAAGMLYLLFGIAFNPAFAALAMALSSVSVVLNSLRLK
jgi:P-type Cu+ transporter